METDTIAAIATPLAPSAIGIIRISGEDAFSVIDRVYRAPDSGKRLSDCESHTVHYGRIVDQGDTVDEVMVLLMRAPHSYTGEDCVEIDCHGGVYVMQRILETVVRHGARPAEPGEFTKRAFLHGKMDLSQAESVIDVITSENDFALRSSLQQLGGGLRDRIAVLRQRTLHELAFVESALDDPEHFTMEHYPEKLLGYLREWKEEIGLLLSRSEEGRLRREGIQTVIVGKPNAGKSSLLNLLSGTDRAIVTDIAGTTRDALEERIQLDGIFLNVVDTAGIRQTGDVVEQIGVEHAKRYLAEADLVLYVVDSSVALDENDGQIAGLLKGHSYLVLMNKSDLPPVVSEKELTSLLPDQPGSVLSFSAKSGEGLEEFKQAIRELFFREEISYNDTLYVTNIRQKAALAEAEEALCDVEQSIVNGMPEDFFSIDLMHALEALGRITGEGVGEELVEEIFSKFCMGK